MRLNVHSSIEVETEWENERETEREGESGSMEIMTHNSWQHQLKMMSVMVVSDVYKGLYLLLYSIPSVEYTIQ